MLAGAYDFGGCSTTLDPRAAEWHLVGATLSYRCAYLPNTLWFENICTDLSGEERRWFLAGNFGASALDAAVDQFQTGRWVFVRVDRATIVHAFTNAGRARPADLQRVLAESPAGSTSGEGVNAREGVAAEILTAMRLLGAIGPDSARSRDVIAKRACGNASTKDSSQVKAAFRDLKARGLIDSARRRGTWLTENGQTEAARD